MSRPGRVRWMLPLGLVALLAGGVLVHLASGAPDGLETVAERQRFASRERPVAPAPVPDYELPFWRTRVGKSLVGVGGTVLTFGLLYGLGRLLARRRRGATRGSTHATAGPDDRGAPPSP